MMCKIDGKRASGHHKTRRRIGRVLQLPEARGPCILHITANHVQNTACHNVSKYSFTRLLPGRIMLPNGCSRNAMRYDQMTATTSLFNNSAINNNNYTGHIANDTVHISLTFIYT